MGRPSGREAVVGLIMITLSPLATLRAHTPRSREDLLCQDFVQYADALTDYAVKSVSHP